MTKKYVAGEDPFGSALGERLYPFLPENRSVGKALLSLYIATAPVLYGVVVEVGKVALFPDALLSFQRATDCEVEDTGIVPAESVKSVDLSEASSHRFNPGTVSGDNVTTPHFAFKYSST